MSKLGKRKERDDGETETQTRGSTLFVSNIPYAVTSTDLQTLFSDIAPVRSAFVVLDRSKGVSKGVGYVSFAIREDAHLAFDKISNEGLSILGRALRVEWAGKKPHDKDTNRDTPKPSPSAQPSQPTPKPKPKPKPQHRKPYDPLAIRTIVITGLPKSINSNSLWKKIRKRNGAEKLEWPVHSDGREDPESAHVLFDSSANALNAVEKLHEHVFKGSLLSVVLKKRIDQARTVNEDRDVNMEEKDENDKDENEDDEDSSDAGEDSEALGVLEDDDESGDEDEDEDGDSADDDADEQPEKPKLPPPESGTTVFVRNVPFTATDDELRTLFRAFGPLRYARITMDNETGRSRGTGFACFWNKDDADKALQQSELLRSETSAGAAMVSQPKKNPFSIPSILTPDPSSTMAQSLVLHGRTLDVVRAVTRDEAGKLKEEGDKKRERADKRNIYLLREGVIFPNSFEAETLSAAEVEKRTSSYNARRALIRSNPSLYISKTRLSVRQIPLFVTERMLKRLAIHSVREFEREVKNGSRDGINDEELAQDVNTDETQQENRKFVGRPTGVKQAKIVRQADRVDPVSNKGRSKGYGFVEMRKHTDALRVLRWSNNNPAVGPLFEQWWKEELGDLIKQEEAKEDKNDARLKRMKDELGSRNVKKKNAVLIVEFSIENVQVVRRRSAHQDEAKVSTKPDHLLKHTDRKTKTNQPPRKVRRLATESSPAETPAKVETTKPGQLIGSMIGRKRKERRKSKS